MILQQSSSNNINICYTIYKTSNDSDELDFFHFTFKPKID